MDNKNKNSNQPEDLNLTKLEIMLKSPLEYSETQLLEILRLLDKIELIFLADDSNPDKVGIKLCSIKSEDGRRWLSVFTGLDEFKSGIESGSLLSQTDGNQAKCIAVKGFFESVCKEAVAKSELDGIVVNPNSSSCAVESEYISKYLTNKKLSENSRHIAAAEAIMEEDIVDLKPLIAELGQIHLAYASTIKNGKKSDIAVEAKSDSGTYYSLFTTADELAAMLDAQGIKYDEIKGKRNLKAAVEYALGKGFDGIAINPSRHKAVIDRATLEKIFKQA